MSDHPAKKQDQARLLVALQDIDHMIREAQDAKTSAKFQEMGFPLDGIAELQKARQELASSIKPQLLNRYERVSKNYDRCIVPVVGELCTGCFAKVPSSFRYEKISVMACESCGRILYFT